MTDSDWAFLGLLFALLGGLIFAWLYLAHIAGFF